MLLIECGARDPLIARQSRRWPLLRPRTEAGLVEGDIGARVGREWRDSRVAGRTPAPERNQRQHGGGGRRAGRQIFPRARCSALPNDDHQGDQAERDARERPRDDAPRRRAGREDEPPSSGAVAPSHDSPPGEQPRETRHAFRHVVGVVVHQRKRRLPNQPREERGCSASDASG